MSTVVSDSSDDEVPANLIKLYLKAQAAAELKNFDYAISLLNAVLEKRPDFKDASILLEAMKQAKGDP